MKNQVSTTFKVISYLVMKIDGTKNPINGNCTSYLCRIVKLKNVIEIQLLHNRYARGGGGANSGSIVSTDRPITAKSDMLA